MIDFDLALQIVLDLANPTGTEIIPLENACDRILAANVNAPFPMPPFSKSAMDGYACRKEDTKKGMKMLEVIAAGEVPEYEITPGTCSKIMTGALLPQGADCVLMVENASERNGLIYGPTPSKDNIIHRGEDLKEGEPVLTAGTLLRPQHLSLLASCGTTQVTVSKKITVGILSTGDELVEPGHPLTAGKVYNSNSWQLMAMVQQMGAVPTYYGIAKDCLIQTQDLLIEALADNQVVLLTGGVSEGDFDWIPVVMLDLGFTILFDRVRIQPGKPTTFAVSRTKEQYIFGLPGNPVSSFVQCLLLVFPFLAALQGATWEPVTTYFPLKGDYKRRQSARMAHIPVRINPDGTCSPVPYNGSAHQAALSTAHGLGRIPVGKYTLKEGDPIEVLLFY